MPLSLTSFSHALAKDLYTYFVATGGTAPYTFAVLPGGAGGSIGASTGLYTAPSDETGQDTIQVTDSVLATAEATILVCTPLELLCDIIQTEMDLTQGQVYLWDQKINIPTDNRLYIAVGIISCKPFSNINRFNSDGTTTQSSNFQALLSLDIFSRGKEARDRKEEVVMALNSIYSRSQQEINSFYTAVLPTGFANLSQIDGAAIPYRFNISVQMQYMVNKTREVPYYDDFADPSILIEPAVLPDTDDLVTEDGDQIVTEDGDPLILEPVA